MATETRQNKNPLWWTAIIVTITTTVIGTALRMITGAISSSAQEPAYFPLLYLVVAFISTLAVVVTYRIVLTQLPSGWIIKGFIVGIFLFIMGDLPYALITGYGTDLSGIVARDMAIAALVNRLVNGLILTYTYQRLSKPKDN